jgi:hypothetical protein
MEHFQVAYCGLYCGACKKFEKGKCRGCEQNEKATWCKIRTCCMDHHYTTCADCIVLPLPSCKIYHNLISKIIGFVIQTDRSKCIDRIREIGIEQYAQEMKKNNRQSFKK